jgi:hypothetical protein
MTPERREGSTSRSAAMSTRADQYDDRKTSQQNPCRSQARATRAVGLMGPRGGRRMPTAPLARSKRDARASAARRQPVILCGSYCEISRLIRARRKHHFEQLGPPRTALHARRRPLPGRQGGFVVSPNRVIGNGFALLTLRLAQAGFGHVGSVVGQGRQSTCSYQSRNPNCSTPECSVPGPCRKPYPSAVLPGDH